MKYEFRKGLSLLLAVVFLLAAGCAWFGTAGADASGDPAGTTNAAETFYVTANASGSYIALLASKGSAYIADIDSYGGFRGYKNEDDYGFFRIRVTSSGYDQTYIWAPSANMNLNGVERSQSLVIGFPYYGEYKIVVTPLSREEINGTYWPQYCLQYWTKAASWAISNASNCRYSYYSGGDGGGGGSQPSGNYQVTVYCVDQNGSFIQSYNASVTYSKTIYPRTVSGYTAAVSSGQYITCTNGVCSPASVYFYYSRNAASANVTVYCYDLANNFIKSYTETVSASKTIYPQAITGYTAPSGGQYITFSNGVCTPASVYFYYSRNAVSANVTVYCYDLANNFIKSYTETVSASKTIYPQAIAGYTTPTGGQYVTFSNGVCSPNSVSFFYAKQAVSGTVAINCYDLNGTCIRSYTETITQSKTIYPQAISGYNTPTGGQYITFSNGVCSPASVSFYYQKTPASGTVAVSCYDENGTYIRSYTETITANRTIYPQAISGYEITSGGQYITFSNGICSPSSVTFYYRKYPSSATVSVSCVDDSGAWLNSYTETITESKTIYPKAISGYDIASGGQYITFSNGTCSPNSVTFKYQKIRNPATLTVNCYDENGTFIKSYTETLTASKTVNPQAISGYNIASEGQYVSYSDGTCSPASISFSYKKIPAPATLTIRCIDNNGNVIRTDKESITANKTITPPVITGYTALSPSQQVTYSDGKCSPAQIDFQYQIGSSVKPGTNPRMAYPASWDTQFKPGTATHNDGSNADRIQRIANLYDDDASTSFFWMIYTREMQDNIPEFTAYFNGDSISGIGIRNGNLKSSNAFKQYARPKMMDVRIYDASGNVYKTTLTIPDGYSKDYREFSFGTTYTNVSRVEICFTEKSYFYYGSAQTNVCHIADIAFFK